MKDGYTISSNKSKMDLDAIYKYLTQSYWSENIPRHIIKKAIENSFCFGVFYESKQIGFARVITDYATFAYLADVYILKEHRGQGLSKELIEYILNKNELQGIRRFLLVTKDAHGLYKKFGFKNLSNSNSFMEIVNQNIYKNFKLKI